MSDLKRVKELCSKYVEQEEHVAACEEALKQAKKIYNRTRMDVLPELMQEVGITSITLDDGSVVELKEEVSAKIPDPFKVMAYEWLEQHGFGGIIKTKVIAEFGKDERKEAVEFARHAAEDHERVSLDESVHPQTLKAFVRERMEVGDPLPMELFGVYPYNIAKLKRSKSHGK